MYLTSLETNKMNKNGPCLCNNMFTVTVDNMRLGRQEFQGGPVIY